VVPFRKGQHCTVWLPYTMILQRLQLYTIKREDKQVLNVVISWYFFDLHICTRFQDNEMYHDIV